MARSHLLVACCCTALLGAALPPQAQAQAPVMQTPAPTVSDAADVERLLRGGRIAEALARVDRALADKRDDAQLRFLRGAVLAEAKRNDEAEAEFLGLTRDHPQLAEPYNNLAVLYAGRGLYNKAREALEAAVRNNPGYAVAHENLGDVYARLAAASYARARQLDPGNRSAAPKITALRQAFSAAAPGDGAASSTPAASAPAPAR